MPSQADNVVPIRPHVGYAAVAHALLASGLGTPLPLPRGRKSPPPDGWTGSAAPYASGPDVQAWTESHGDGNTGLRLAPALVGIDVDAYDGRPGAQTMAALTHELGQLPGTVVVTSRGFATTGDPSGIRLYRLPQGADQSLMRDVGPGVELIRAGHRYAVVAGTHPDTGAAYRWYGSGTGQELASLPTLAQIPELPAAWVAHLTSPSSATHAAHREDRATDDGPAWAGQDDELQGRIHRYLDRIITEESATLAQVASWPEGHRDDHGRGWEKITADLANRLGRLERAGWTPEGWGWSALARIVPDVVARAVGLPDVWRRQRDRRDPAPFPAELAKSPVSLDEMAGKASSAATALASSSALVGNVVDVDLVRLGELGQFTESAISERFAEHVRGRMIHVTGMGWYRYAPAAGIWEEMDDDTATEVARRYFKREVKALVDDGKDSDLRKAVVKLGKRSYITNFLALARGQEAVKVDSKMLDAAPDLLCTPSGVVDLRTGQQHPHDPRYLMTRSTSASYRPGATHPDWTAALQAVRPDAHEWLQRVMGQALTGYPPRDDVMPIAQGGGSNAKTTITGAVLAALGDYAAQLSQRALGGRDGDVPTELMALRGARFALSEELPDGATLNLKRLKDALGQKSMKARYMRRDEVEWVSSHTLMMTSNYRPRVTETDDGTWRRLALLVFPFRYRKPHEPIETPYDRPADLNLRPRLLAGDDDRAEAVLAWLVDGARRWYAEGEAPMPASVATDTAAWRREADEVRAFLTDNVEFDPSARASSADLYLAYVEWAANHGRRARDDADFTALLEAHSLALQHRITKRRTTALDGISRWPGHGAVTPPLGSAKVAVWFGIRFIEATP